MKTGLTSTILLAASALVRADIPAVCDCNSSITDTPDFRITNFKMEYNTSGDDMATYSFHFAYWPGQSQSNCSRSIKSAQGEYWADFVSQGAYDCSDTPTTNPESSSISFGKNDSYEPNGRTITFDSLWLNNDYSDYCGYRCFQRGYFDIRDEDFQALDILGAMSLRYIGPSSFNVQNEFVITPE